VRRNNGQNKEPTPVTKKNSTALQPAATRKNLLNNELRQLSVTGIECN
jgi:hypothetical protein